MDRPKIPVDLIIAKMAAEAEKAQERLEKARDILQGPLEVDIGATPYDLVYEEDRVTVRHYRPEAATSPKPPLLLVHALLHRETILDLQPNRSIVRSLLKEGVEVYLVDWGRPTRRDRYLTLDDHINGYLDNIVDFIRLRHRLPQVHLLGICLGGTLAAIYAALHPEKVKNLVTIATPTQFHTDKGLLHIWMREIDGDRLVDTFGNLPGNLLNIALFLLNPVRLLLDKYVGFLENMDNKEFVENFIRMEKWIFDSPDVPGETLRQLIKDLYQQNLLITGHLDIGGLKVDLQRITMPLLNIYAEFDHLVPAEACEGLANRVGSRDVQEMRLDTGHIGIYVSSLFHREIIPQIAAWLAAREA